MGLDIKVEFVKLSGAAYFAFFAVLMLGAALAFRQVARRYRPSSGSEAG